MNALAEKAFMELENSVKKVIATIDNVLLVRNASLQPVINAYAKKGLLLIRTLTSA